MARKLSSREAGLLLALGALAVAYFWYASRQDSSASASASASAAKGAAGGAEKSPAVLMALLTKKVEGYDPEGRDLFKYAVRPPTRAELEQQRLERERQQRLIDEEAKARAEAAARAAADAEKHQAELVRNPPPPQPPAINFKYVGYLGPKTEKVAVFQDGDEILVARKGEIVRDQFKVVDIKLESVVMGYTRPEFKDMTRELTLTPASK